MKVLFVHTEPRQLTSHRLPQAFAALVNGYDLHFSFVGHRGRFSAGAVWKLFKTYRRLNPDVVHLFGVHAIVHGVLALPRCKVISSFTGLGKAWESRLVRAFLRAAPLGTAVFQNEDDRMAVGIGGEIIEGSGIDLEYFKAMPLPQGPITYGYAGRLIPDKGLSDLEVDGRLLIAGEPDPVHPMPHLPNAEYLGHIADMREFWRQVHVAVLPTRREGCPMALLEAIACGRQVMVPDVPGCRNLPRNREELERRMGATVIGQQTVALYARTGVHNGGRCDN